MSGGAPTIEGTRSLVGLALFVGLSIAVLALGGGATASSVGTWYQTLNKPAFNPPDGVFAPVWTGLYALMAMAAWRVWRRGGWAANRREMAAYGLQLALNLGWSVVFFGLRQIGWGLVEMVGLFAAMVWTTVLFARRDRLAAWLFAPCLAWVGFALVLNTALWRLN